MLERLGDSMHHRLILVHLCSRPMAHGRMSRVDFLGVTPYGHSGVMNGLILRNLGPIVANSPITDIYYIYAPSEIEGLRPRTLQGATPRPLRRLVLVSHVARLESPYFGSLGSDGLLASGLER